MKGKSLFILLVSILIIAMPMAAFATDEPTEPAEKNVITDSIVQTEAPSTEPQPAEDVTGEKNPGTDAPSGDNVPDNASDADTVSPEPDPGYSDDGWIDWFPEPETTTPEIANTPSPTPTLSDKYPGVDERLKNRGYVDLSDLNIPAASEADIAALASAYGDTITVITENGCIVAVIFEEDEASESAYNESDNDDSADVNVIAEEENGTKADTAAISESKTDEPAPVKVPEETEFPPMQEVFAGLVVGLVGILKGLQILI